MPAIFHQKTLFQTPKATPRQCKWTRQTLKGHRRTFKDFRRDHRTYLQMKDSLHTYSEHISKLALSRVPSCFSCFSVLHFVAWSCVVLSFHASLDPNVLSGAITRLRCVADLHSLRHGSKVLTERRGCKSVDWAVASFQCKSLKFAQERCTGTSIGWCNDGWGIATSKSPSIKQCHHFNSQDLVWKCCPGLAAHVSGSATCPAVVTKNLAGCYERSSPNSNGRANCSSIPTEGAYPLVNQRGKWKDPMPNKRIVLKHLDNPWHVEFAHPCFPLVIEYSLNCAWYSYGSSEVLPHHGATDGSTKSWD